MLAARSRRASASGPDRQSQEDPAADARARSPAAPAAPLCRDDRSDHDQPIYPNRVKDLAIDGPDQLWVADITFVPSIRASPMSR
jgi:hypothetical protein